MSIFIWLFSYIIKRLQDELGNTPLYVNCYLYELCNYQSPFLLYLIGIRHEC